MRADNIKIIVDIVRSFLFKESPKELNSVDKWLLAELEARLSADASEILRKQLRRVNSIDHPGFGVQLLLNTFGPDGLLANDVDLFPAQDSSLKIATAGYAHKFRSYKAEFWLVRGQLNSIFFIRGEKTDDYHPQPQLDYFRMENDPMKASPPPPEPNSFTGWLSEWKDRYRFSDLAAPVDKETREEYLRQCEATFPQDFLELLTQADGFTIDDSCVMGAAEMYDVSLDDGDYYLIAEVNQGQDNQGSIGVRRRSRDGMLYFLSHEGLPAKPLGKSFRAALEKYLPPLK